MIALNFQPHIHESSTKPFVPAIPAPLPHPSKSPPSIKDPLRSGLLQELSPK